LDPNHLSRDNIFNGGQVPKLSLEFDEADIRTLIPPGYSKPVS
jgi:hypothetical protein